MSNAHGDTVGKDLDRQSLSQILHDLELKLLYGLEVRPAAASAFEAKLKAGQSSLKEETLWYRLVAGGQVPRYLRLRPRPRVSAVAEGADDQVLAQANSMIDRVSVELLVSQPSLTIDVRGVESR